MFTIELTWDTFTVEGAPIALTVLKYGEAEFAHPTTGNTPSFTLASGAIVEK